MDPPGYGSVYPINIFSLYKQNVEIFSQIMETEFRFRFNKTSFFCSETISITLQINVFHILFFDRKEMILWSCIHRAVDLEFMKQFNVK